MACKREERSHRTDRGARARVPLRECTASVCRGPPHRPHWPRIANEPGRQSVCVSESERCSCSNAVRPRRRSLQRYGRVYLLSILNPPSSKALHRRWRQRRTAGRYASKCFSIRSLRPSLAANQRPNTAMFPHALSLRCSKPHKNALDRKGAAMELDGTVG